jgi:integrase/recombinase XerD
MSLGRQAKTLSKAQIEAVVGYLSSTRYPLRNRVILFLSVKAGLRAKEIANLTWPMVTDSSGFVGDVIRLENRASKGKFGGRVVPINAALKEVLEELHRKKWLADRGYVIRTERSQRTSPQAIVNLFSKWYKDVGLQGCSSHSGRRTFITNAARRISTVGGSLRDVQLLAGHTNLRTTQGYIEADGEAQRRVVGLF